MTSIGLFITILIQIYSFIMLARVLMTWVNIDPSGPLARTLYDLTEPVLRPVRNALPPTAGLDFSPMIVLVLLQLLGRILVSMFTA